MTTLTTLSIHNPATGQTLTELPADDAASVAAKAARARAVDCGVANAATREAWERAILPPLADRKACITRFRAAVVRDLPELAATMTTETGKPIAMSRNELNGLLGRLDFFVAQVDQAIASETVFDEGGMTEQIQHIPLGVVANISAWNYPWFVGCNVIVPALLAGNAVLYKPSEFAALTGLAIVRLLHEAGVPADVLAPVIGDGAVGTALLAQKIDGLFFTGSHATGVKIAQALAPRLVKLQLELGGKDPSYVCEDANVANAAASLADGAMYNTGQSCCSVERIYVHEAIYEAFVAEFVKTVAGFKSGDPMRDDTYIGAITRGPQHGPDARGKLRPHHRHPESRQRRRGGAPDERHPLWPDGRGLHPRRGARQGPAGPGQRRQHLLELLRPRQPPPALERPWRFRHRPHAVGAGHTDLHPAQGLAPAAAMKLTLFDLDHTLLSGDSDVLWCDFLIEQGVLDRVSFAERNADIEARYKAGTVDAQEFANFYVGTLGGRSPGQWEPLRQTFLATWIVPRIPQAALDLVRRHHDAGDLVVMTTATNRFITELTALYLDIEHLIATEPEIHDGMFTGQTTGTLNMREGKVKRLQAWLTASGRRLADFKSTAYSDSINDLPLLKAVNRAVAVDPDERLKAEARQRGWGRLHLTR